MSIPKITRNESGPYECQATNNPNENPLVSTTNILVLYTPTIYKSESTSSIKSWDSNVIKLQCMARGVPAPTITWYTPGGQPITSGVRSFVGGSDVTVLSTRDSGDYGQYKCRASNVVGNDDHVIMVTQLFPPGPPYITITDDDIEASFVVIAWLKPVSDGGSAVIDYKVQINTTQEKSTSNHHVLFSGLNASTNYLVKVYARNVVGYGKASVKVITTRKRDTNIAITENSNRKQCDQEKQNTYVAVIVVCVAIIIISAIFNMIQLVYTKKKLRENHGQTSRLPSFQQYAIAMEENTSPIDQMPGVSPSHEMGEQMELLQQSRGSHGNSVTPAAQNVDSVANMSSLPHSYHQNLMLSLT